MKKPNAFLPIFFAVLIQACLGIAYLWSLFQTNIAKMLFAGDNAQAAIAYSTLLFMLTVGSFIGGKLAIKYNTKIVVIIGGFILSAGFFLSGFVPANAGWLLWLTYGVLGGIGMGFTYSTTIACAQKWMPHKKGLVTGIIVAALGFGGVIFTPVIKWLIGISNEFTTFKVLAGVFLVVCTIGGFFMKNPPEGHLADKVVAGGKAKANVDYSTKEVLKSWKFYCVAGALMFGCMGGLMMIGFASPIAIGRGFDAATAATGVMLISLFNSLGRLTWGIVSDKLGRKNTITILLLGGTILSMLVNAASGWWIFALIALIGFFYGGLLGTFPAITSDLFGTKNVSSNYGLVLVGFGVGAVAASYIAGHFKNIAKEDISLMFPAFIIASVCAFVGVILIQLLRIKKKAD